MMTVLDEIEGMQQTNRAVQIVIALAVIVAVAYGVNRINKKIVNDTNIARDTGRIADALERAHPAEVFEGEYSTRRDGVMRSVPCKYGEVYALTPEDGVAACSSMKPASGK